MNDGDSIKLKSKSFVPAQTPMIEDKAVSYILSLVIWVKTPLAGLAHSEVSLLIRVGSGLVVM